MHKEDDGFTVYPLDKDRKIWRGNEKKKDEESNDHEHDEEGEI
mgnify:CR=1 FL=1